MLRFSHLNERKFCHNFKYAPIIISDCGSEGETIILCFLCETLLYGSGKYKDTVNKSILLIKLLSLKTTD